MSTASDNNSALPPRANDTAGAELQKLWAEGINSGPGKFGSMDEIKREAHRRRWIQADYVNM